MAKVMLVQPWNYHDEGVKKYNRAYEWRNGPYSLLLLATILRKHGHDVAVVDMGRDLVGLKGNVDACLAKFSTTIQQFSPDIIGFSFFSVHYLETQKAVAVARQACTSAGLKPMFIAGGIHTSVEPKATITELGFDYSFVGAADLGIVQLADEQKPETVSGVVSSGTPITKGEEVQSLDSLPFPDWGLCDYRFYAYPSYARLKIRRTGSLDMIMGRGCPYRCAFCAYNTLSPVRFYSAEYLVEQMEYMNRQFGVRGIYFIDSTIGNNQRLLREFSELMIRRGTSQRIEWYGNIRADQVKEELLKLMWRAGCRYLLYGFESASQRVLDLMNKKTTVEDNYRAAQLHNKLKFPYNASMILGYPGEREEDIQKTFEFLRKTQPLSIGINWYVPLPGSDDYARLKAQGVIKTEDPMEWRRIGEVNKSRVYADIPEDTFRELFAQAQQLANVTIPKTAYPSWGYKSSPLFDLSALKTRLFNMYSHRSYSDVSSKSSETSPSHQETLARWENPFEVLRRKWHEVPMVDKRISTKELLEMPDKKLLDLWSRIRLEATTAENFDVRGWYHLLYRDILREKLVMDVGSGLGIDGITFAQHGARLSFVDIVESNLAVLERLCRLLNLTNVDFCYLENLNSLSALPANYDVIWCQGSLINAPFEVTRVEVQELLKHLPVGGRWIELAYPKARWERDGKLPFEKWGELTDGQGTPWVEWYDLPKLKALFEPAQFDVILHFEFHNSDFNWFDLIRRS